MPTWHPTSHKEVLTSGQEPCQVRSVSSSRILVHHSTTPQQPTRYRVKYGVSARIPDKTRSGDTIVSTTFEESSLSTLPPRWWSASFSYFVATASAPRVRVQAYPKASTTQFVFQLPITEEVEVRYLVIGDDWSLRKVYEPYHFYCCVVSSCSNCRAV